MKNVFVGREKEIRDFVSFSAISSPYDMLFIYSQDKLSFGKGTGKSRLLHKFLETMPANSIRPVLWTKEIIDFYYLENRSEEGLFRAIIRQVAEISNQNEGIRLILDKIAEYESSRKTIIGLQAQLALRREIQESFIIWIKNTLSEFGARKLLLFFDSFEYVENVGGFVDSLVWLFTNLQENLKVVIVSRNYFSWEKHLSPLPKQPKLSIFRLQVKGFTKSDVKKYFESINVNITPEEIDRIKDATHGCPNKLGLICQLMKCRLINTKFLNEISEENLDSSIASVICENKDEPSIKLMLYMAHAACRLQLMTLSYLLPSDDCSKCLEGINESLVITFITPKNEFALDDEIQDLLNYLVWPIIDPDKDIRFGISSRIIDDYHQRGISKENLLETNAITNYVHHQEFVSSSGCYKLFETLYQKAKSIRNYSMCFALLHEMRKFNLSDKRIDELDLLSAELDLQEYRIASAQKSFEKLKDKFQARKDDYSLARCKEGMGDCDAASGRLQDAVNNLLESLTIYQMLRSLNEIIWITVRLGEIYASMGKYTIAEEYFTRVVYVFTPDETSGILYKRVLARANAGLGFVYRRHGKLDEALLKFEESLRIKREIGENWDLGISLVGVGNIWRDLSSKKELAAKKQDLFDKAINYYKEACESSTYSKDLLGLVRALEDWGWLEVLLNKQCRKNKNLDEANYHLEEATRLANESLNLCDRYGFYWDYAANYHTLLHVAIDKGDRGGEERYAKMLFESAKKWSDGFMLFDAIMHLAIIAERHDDYKEVQKLSLLMNSYTTQGYQFPYFVGLMAKIEGDIEFRRQNKDQAINLYCRWLENMIQQPFGSAGLHTFLDEVNQLEKILQQLPVNEREKWLLTLMSYWRAAQIDSKNEFKYLLEIEKEVSGGKS